MIRVVWLLAILPSMVWAQKDSQPSLSEEVVAAVERVNSLRENLVQGVKGKVDATTFQAVCKPVGKTAKELAQQNGWRFRQVSHRYRNPAHKPTRKERGALRKFQKDPQLISFWLEEENQLTYYRRITVRKACLNCHGPKEKRPQFIKEKYSKDLAFGFKEGDLRGFYAVTPLGAQQK